MTTVLLMTSDTEKKKAIEGVCNAMDMKLKEIKGSDINLPVGGLLGMPINGEPKQTAPVLYNPPELMIFNSITDADLDRFFDKYQEAGIEPITFKGAITTHNITWSPYEFIIEYEKEQG